MNFSDAMEAPIVEQIDGKDYTLPLLTVEDYIPWTQELHNARRTLSRQLVHQMQRAPEMEKFRMLRMAEFDEPTLDDIAKLVWTPAGAKRVIDAAMVKAGITDPAERERLMKLIPPRRFTTLAVDLSALFEKAPAVSNGNGKAAVPDPVPNPSGAQEVNLPPAPLSPAATGLPTA